MQYKFKIVEVIIDTKKASTTPVKIIFEEMFSIEEHAIFEFYLKGPFLHPINDTCIDTSVAPMIASICPKTELKFKSLITDDRNKRTMGRILSIIIEVLNNVTKNYSHDYTRNSKSVNINVVDGAFEI